MIAFLDLNAATQELREELNAASHKFLDSGWYVLGNEVNEFEQEYANYCGAAFCVGIANGLDAILLALKAVGIKPGDEVIVPSNTYIATWLAVTHLGAVPVPVEPDPETLNIDSDKIRENVGSKTKAIIPVNLYGQPVDYSSIREVAVEANLPIIVDNAQAHGARYNNDVVGGLADIECHSFYPSKNLGALGDGGAITTNNPYYAEQISLLRNYGSRVRYYNEVCGYNSRLDELQAAFLRVKLRYLDQWNQRRKIIAAKYLEGLASIPGLVLPKVPDWADPVWHLFVVRCKQRDELQRYLLDHGIQTLIHYPVPPHLSEAYSHLGYQAGSFPVAEELANTVLSLPIGPHLTYPHVETVIQAIRQFCKKKQ